MKQFRDKYGYTNVNDALFKNDTYTISSNTGNINHLKDALDTFNGSDIKLLNSISSFYDKDDDKNESEKKIKEALMKIDADEYKNWKINGTQEPSLKQIQNYKEYSEFKSSKFKIEKEPEYKEGQIQNLYFVFVK